MSLVATSLLTLLALTTESNANFSGRATWYYDGLGACGHWNKNTDYIVALPPIEYAGGTRCGRSIRVHYKNRQIVARIVDLCPSCGWTGIDLSKNAFRALAPLEKGVVHVVWEYI